MAINHIGGNSRGSDMTESQADKYLKHNDHIDLLADRFLQHKALAIGFSPGGSYALSVEDWTETFHYELNSDASPSVDQDFDFLLPAGLQGQAVILNSSGFTATVLVDASPTGRSVVIPDGAIAHVYSDGANVDELKRDVHDVSFFIPTPLPDVPLGLFMAARAFSLPAGLPLSQAYALNAPDSGEGDKVFDIQKNGSTIGTVTFSALSNAGSFSFVSQVNFAAGDRLSLLGYPSPSPDLEATSLANVAVTFAGRPA